MSEEKKRKGGNIELDLEPGDPQRIHAWGLVVGTDTSAKIILTHNALMDKMLWIRVKAVDEKKEEGEIEQ